MKNKKGVSAQLGEYAVYVKIALWIIIFMIVYPMVKNAVNGIKNGLNINGAAADAAAGAPALRLAVVQSYATTIHDQVSGITNGGYTVQQNLKLCLNDGEVSTLSHYYMRTYSQSLLTVAKREMNSFWSFSKSFESLPAYIINNLS